MADDHAVNYTSRYVNNIRRKWQKVYRMKVPTSNPEIPEEARVAKKNNYKIGSKAGLGIEKATFDLAAGRLTDPNATPDETETTNEYNSILSLPTSTTHSSATNRRTHIKNTHQSRVGHHQSNTGKYDLINMWQMSLIQERDDRKWEREERAIEKKEREDERMIRMQERDKERKEEKEREEERMIRIQGSKEERKEERQDFCELMMTVLTGVTSVLTTN